MSLRLSPSDPQLCNAADSGIIPVWRACSTPKDLPNSFGLRRAVPIDKLTRTAAPLSSVAPLPMWKLDKHRWWPLPFHCTVHHESRESATTVVPFVKVNPRSRTTVLNSVALLPSLSFPTGLLQTAPCLLFSPRGIIYLPPSYQRV